MQKINLDRNVVIEFTPAELQVVAEQLHKGIYVQVSGVIATIERQVIAQLQPEVDSIKKEGKAGDKKVDKKLVATNGAGNNK